MKTKKKKRKSGIKPGEGKEARVERHDLFCLEYIKDYNATRAAIAAGYSEDSARAIGCKLLTKDNIKARVTMFTYERAARVQLDGDQILQETKKLALSDIRKLIDPETGCVLPAHDWPDDIASAVAGFEVRETFHPITGKLTGYVKKIKLWDKPKPIELLGKNKGIFKETIEANVNANVTQATPEQIDAAVKKTRTSV
jgi:phage terminase small subunit